MAQTTAVPSAQIRCSTVASSRASATFARRTPRLILYGNVSKPEFLAYYVEKGYAAAAVGLGPDQDTAATVELFTMQRH